MKVRRIPLLVRNFAFAALLLFCAVAVYHGLDRYPLQRDITQNASNSLERGSVDVLLQLQGPVKITVFSTEQDAKQGDLRKLISDYVALYQRYKPDIALAFVDPVQHPDEVRKAEIQANGEMVVEYAGRREHLTMLNEQALTGALASLAHRHDQLIMYMDGHGERKLDGLANYDLGEFGKRLHQLGFRLNSLNLSVAQEVPSNVSLLVITQPQVDWMPGEVDKVLRYVENGGNLLWLLDAEPLHGLEDLSEKLGLVLPPGVILDPTSEEMRTPITWALGSGYPPHAITHNFSLITVFPFARAIDWQENSLWQHSTVVEAAPRGWVSQNPPPADKAARAKPHFNRNRDVPGPVTVALALERDINDRGQRIVVVGSGSFLANSFSGNGGNLDLGVNMVNWLTNEEKLITIMPRTAKDNTVTLSKTQTAVISIGLVIALPLLLALVGALQWWRRRQ